MPTQQQAALVLRPVGGSNTVTNIKMLYGPATIGTVVPTTGALSSVNLNDSDNAAGWIFNIPADGSITDVGIYIATETGTSPAYNCGLVTLDSSGRPTTSAYGGSAITSAQWTSTGFKWVTLSTPATAVAGDYAAVHIYPSGSTPDGSNFVAVPNAGVVLGLGLNVNFTVAWGAATTSGAAGFAVRYSDGTVHGIALSTNTVHVLLRSNTTPDEVGSKFTVPVQMVCNGARIFHATAGIEASATVDIVLYAGDDTVLATMSISDKDYIDDVAFIDLYWDDVTLRPGNDYRLIVKPTTGASGGIYVPKWTFDSTTALAAIPCGDTWYYTSRVDAGTWTDDTSSICPFGLWIRTMEFTSEYGFSG